MTAPAGVTPAPRPFGAPGHTGVAMSGNSWTTEIFVQHSPEQVFDAVTNVRGWWDREIDGGTTAVGDEFTVTDHGSLRCRS